MSFKHLKNMIHELMSHKSGVSEQERVKITASINDHISMFNKDFRIEMAEIHELKQYMTHLVDARAEVKNGNMLSAVEHLKKAHNLIIDIEHKLRYLYKNEHKWLE